MVAIRRAETDADYGELGRLIRAYVEWLPFEIAFQDVDQELAELRSRYGPPGGAAFLAVDGGGAVVGAVALKDLGDGACEMKRLYVSQEARGVGAGRSLTLAVVAEGRRLGYQVMRLDTVPELMPEANALYRRMGFVECPPYVYNPLPDVRFLELAL